MKLFKIGLRLWIGITSLFGFLGGWVLIAHSPKPVSTARSAPMAPLAVPTTLPTLAPLQAFTNSPGSTLLNIPSIITPTTPSIDLIPQQPIFTTGGS